MKKNNLIYNAESHSNDNRVNPPLYHSRYRHLVELKKNIIKFIDEEIKPIHFPILADLGCGEIPYHGMILPYVSQYYAIDLPGNSRATHIVDSSTNRTNLPDNSVDIVWSVMVLEHVASPSDYLSEALRILKPGGKLLLSTHGHWMFHPDPIDYWRWTSQGLRVEVERAGFQFKSMWGMMGLLSMSVQLFQDAVILHFPFVKIWGRPFSFIMQRFVSIAVWLENKSKTTREYKNKDACVFFICAVK